MDDGPKYITEHDAATEFSRLAAGQIISFMAIRFLLTDIATKDRSPEQAQDYFENFQRRLNGFVDNMPEPENETEKGLLAALKSSVDKLTSGIKFERAEG